MTERNKRIVFALFAILALMCFSTAALAAVSVGASPAVLSSEGKVDITVTLKNDGIGAMENINISSSDVTVEFDTAGVVIDEGAEQAFVKSVQVSEEMIDKAIGFEITWTQGGEEKSSETSVTVKRAAIANAISVRRSVSSKTASPGETITIKYTVKNLGTTKLTKVAITDKEIGGKSPIVSGITIEAGEVYEYSYQYKMGYSTVISQPVVTYEIGSQSRVYDDTEAMTLGMVNTKLTVEVEQGVATESGVPFTIYLTNNGNQKIKDIKIVDELGNRVAGEQFTLAVGETKSISCNISNEKERYVVFTITGIDASGEEYTDKTESQVVRRYIDPTSLGMEFSVTVLETLNSQGFIRVKFTVNNTGTVDYTSLTVKEESAGEIRRIENVTPGNHEIEEDVYVGIPRDLMFTLEVTDPVGNPYTYTANVTADYIGIADTVNATPTAEAVNSIEEMGMALDNAVSNTLVTILIVLGILSALAITAIITLTSMEKKMKARAAQRKQESRR
ncbi:MAG: hypothetical protein IJO48_00630 [Clostridia bacterium]|nr:hypothetical protein [Clostridia bacterium]